ncbi:hypothetical protein [Algoriphagus aquimarinus]|uniref:Outer membrane protein beta-barrel domain-containing protein n=1 Tax=Algoriphagus aquimarinus TaxID=237018 RepID=A0A5C7AAJ0_9BACT|nr:hypothetical protein [Algoriphagus aquimarinus]TXE02524.1 hypothetical protein ESV85_21275 [Algoriphagus aquimarinus]
MKLRTSKIQCLLGLLFLSFASIAQEGKVMDSYVILNSGKEVKGHIEGKFDLETYTEIIFITHSGEKSVYLPGEIQGFGLESGRFFKSETIPLQDQAVFAQVLVSGMLELYKWDNKYFINREGTVIELKVNKSTRTENGKLVNVNSNQYVGVLTLAMNDKCGVGLKRRIETTRLTDRDLIALFSEYYTCNSQPFEIYASEVPYSKLAFRLQGGLGLIGMMEYESTKKDVNYSLDKASAPYFELGVRFSEFRNAPRLLVDLGLGYMSESNTLLLDASLVSFDLSGSEKYKSSSFLVPIHLSYIVYRQNRNEVYTGVGLTFWASKFKADMGELVIDNGEPNPNVINSIFVDRKEMAVSPNLKVGYRRALSEETGLFVELKGDFLIKNMDFYPLTYHAVYNYLVGTLSVGIEL